jgi:hypothetical protein
VRCRAGLGGRLDLNSFIQTRQMYTYKIPVGNRVRIIAYQTHTRLPNEWRFCPISIPMGIIFVSYPYPNRGIPHGLTGIGSPLTSLNVTIEFLLTVTSHELSLFFALGYHAVFTLSDATLILIPLPQATAPAQRARDVAGGPHPAGQFELILQCVATKDSKTAENRR